VPIAQACGMPSAGREVNPGGPALLALGLAALIAAIFAPTAIAAPSPVAAYAFEEGSGSTLTDSAASHDGTISGATWTASGKYGGALDFDGNDKVTIADANDLDFTSAFTLEAWVQPDSYAAGRPIVSKGELSGPNGYMLTGEANGKPQSLIANTTTKSVTGPTALPKDGTWSHVAVTSDGTTLRLYVGGELKAEAPALVLKATSGVLEIGHSVFSGYFDGRIDEVRIYGVTLSESQIKADRDTPIGDPHDVRREGAAYNLNFDLDGVDDYRVDADIAVLHRGIWSEEDPTTNVVHRVDCANPNPWLEVRGKYIQPDHEDPDWEPDELLNEAAESLPYGPYGCLDNSVNTTEPLGTMSHGRSTEIDGIHGLGGIAPGTRIWGVRVLSGDIVFSRYRNPVSLPQHPEYDPEAPLWLPEMGTAHVVAGLDWVAAHADQIDVAYFQIGCPREGFELEGFEGPYCDAAIIDEAIDRVIDKGVVVVAAAGNGGGEFGSDAGGFDSELLAPQGNPGVLTVSSVRDDDGKPGGSSKGGDCGQVMDDQRLNLPDYEPFAVASSYGTTVDMAAALCGDTGGASEKIAGAAAALASQCNPDDREGVEFIIDTLMAEGDTGEIAEGGWLDDSGDGWKEPLLNLRDEEVFDPVLLNVKEPAKSEKPSAEGCQWRSHQAESDVGSDGRADLVAIDAEEGSAKVFAGTVEGPETAGPTTSLKGQLDPALLDGKGSYAIDSADVDGDRHADLVRMNATGGIVVHPGEAEGGFGSGVSSLAGVMPAMNNSGDFEPIAVADVNGDERADLVALQGSQLRTYPGQANDTFGAAISSGLTLDSALLDGKGAYCLDVIDVSGEVLDQKEPIDYNARHSYADLVVSNTDGSVYVYKGRADGKFDAAVKAATLNPVLNDGTGAEPIGLGDVDRDRRADLLALEGTTLKLYRAKADGTFAAASKAYEGSVDSSLLDGKGEELIGLLDYSRDGLADLLSLSEDGTLLSYAAQRDFTFADPVASAGSLPSLRHSTKGHELPAEKPVLRRLSCAAAGCSLPPPPPVAAYSFNAGSGSTLTDSAASHDGTISGATWTASGKYGGALDFDGNDKVTIADANDLDFTSSFTLEAWVQPDSYAAGRPIVSKGELSGPNGYMLTGEANGKPQSLIANTTTKSVTGPTALPKDGTWSHVAVTSDGTTLRLYVGGELKAEAPALVLKATSGVLEIGHSVFSGYFDGRIDEVRIYGVTLSESQIKADRDSAL
jgi:concanavalin A-like lectin/glucanase superfamily protein/VCBS repeat protein